VLHQFAKLGGGANLEVIGPHKPVDPVMAKII
jgi:hypothetical protein